MTKQQPQIQEPTTLSSYLRLIASGFIMGSADIVPGVSGGTMALILGIYEELLEAVKSVDLTVIRLALRFRLREAVALVPWRFLLALGLGIGSAVVVMSGILTYLLEEYPVFVFAFFFGLVTASILAIGASINEWRPLVALGLLAGTSISFVVVGLVPIQASHDPITLFFSGMFAIVAMILPGISGAFILLILGQYEYVLHAVAAFDLLPIIIVAAGCVVGLLTFARVLSWLLAKARDVVIAVLVGFMVGSLRKIWPWREIVEKGVDTEVELSSLHEVLVLPQFDSPEFFISNGLLLAGFIIVTLMDHRKTQSNPVILLAGRLVGQLFSVEAEV